MSKHQKIGLHNLKSAYIDVLPHKTAESTEAAAKAAARAKDQAVDEVAADKMLAFQLTRNRWAREVVEHIGKRMVAYFLDIDIRHSDPTERFRNFMRKRLTMADIQAAPV